MLTTLVSLGAPTTTLAPTCSSITHKSDCGFVGIDQGGCEAKGCCWQPSNGASDPWCFYKSEHCVILKCKPSRRFMSGGAGSHEGHDPPCPLRSHIARPQTDIDSYCVERYVTWFYF